MLTVKAKRSDLRKIRMGQNKVLVAPAKCKRITEVGTVHPPGMSTDFMAIQSIVVKIFQSAPK